MVRANNKIQGLSENEVLRSREKYGINSLRTNDDRTFIHVLKDVVLEPMLIMLVVACAVYFFMRQYDEGLIMLISIFLVAGISLFQEYRSRNAILALKKISPLRAKVTRNGEIVQIVTEDIVVDDIMLIAEGENIAADGTIFSSNDFSVDESIITGESFPVFKNQDSTIYKGTLVTSGAATVQVSAVGDKTVLGKIGSSLREIETVRTPLQLQIRSFVRSMVWFGGIAFFIVFFINYYHSQNLMFGLLQGLTLAMSVLPEEIPVAFSTFQALGAFRLLRHNIIVKQPQFVETLGSATVICIDKTGTLTQNKMSIDFLYDFETRECISYHAKGSLPQRLIEYAMWASEEDPFDPMEKAIHALYEKTSDHDKRSQYVQVHEYPIGGNPPMMTHIFQNRNNSTIIACKGAPEAILSQTNLPLSDLELIEEQSLRFAKDGYRVLGVGKGIWQGKTYPLSQQEFSFEFLGLIAFNDPPKPNIESTIQAFHRAGIQVKIITGDYPETAVAIARKINLHGSYEYITGKQIEHLPPEDLKQKIKSINIFARMFPEVKLKVIDALKESGEIVAMTGDGVNDTPALKAAHIGIAMGKRGSEAAKATASLIITDDDLGHMVDAIALGRKIYDNLKKAIQYILSIHIPIILIVTLPLVLSWKFNGLFSPVHVIFLELIMGPTCSIIYENEPIEPGTMQRRPRPLLHTFLSGKQLRISMVQGLMITAGCLGFGYYCMQHQQSENIVRTVVFITLLFSNIFLTLVNRSFNYSFVTTMRYKNPLLVLVVIITLLFIIFLLSVPFLTSLFRLEVLPLNYLLTCIIVAFISTFWIEFFKRFAPLKN